MSATGHSSGLPQQITGFQTFVNDGATPVETDWSATTAVTPAVDVPFSATVAAAAGQTIWVRVQQDGNSWSAPASIVVPTL